MEVRIGDNLELLVRGPNVMRGYWKRDDDTRHAFVDDDSVTATRPRSKAVASASSDA